MRKIIRKILNNFNYDIVNVYYKGTEKYKINSTEKGLNLYETPLGKFYLPSFLKKDGIANTIKRGFSFDKIIIDTAKKYITPNSSFLDVGANYGQMSILISKFIERNGTGKVYSFEAEPFVGEILKKNVKINNCKNIEVVLGAVHYKNGEIVIFPEPDFKRFHTYGSYGIDPLATKGRSVDTITIDSLKIQEKISFIKVDVQGSDLFAMQGARELILKNKPVILFEFEEQFQKEFNTSFNDYADFVRSIEYKFIEVIGDINYLIVPIDRNY